MMNFSTVGWFTGVNTTKQTLVIDTDKEGMEEAKRLSNDLSDLFDEIIINKVKE